MRLSLGRSAALLLLCGSSAACHYALDTRSLFASLTYPGGDAPKAPAIAFQLYSRLELEGVTSFDAPAKVAACYRKIDAANLRDLGDLMAERDPNDDVWAGNVCRAARGGLPQECNLAALGDDAPRALLALAHMGGVVRGFSKATETTKAGDDWLLVQGVETMKKVATILEATPPRHAMPPPGPHPVDHKLVEPGDEPVLVLSGGSANGAFTAGVMFQLLWARERAMKKVLTGVPAADLEWTRASLERGTRFGALVGTSVGSLISQVLDLYFVDPSTKPTAAQKKLLDECVAEGVKASSSSELAKPSEPGCFSGWPETTYLSFDPSIAPDRPFQMCALRKLVNSFVDIEEKQLLCVQPGSVTRAVGSLGEPVAGLIRFDPMTSTIVDPILKGFGKLMSENDTTRVVVSVEVQQNQTFGLDERTCRLLPSKPGMPGAPLESGGLEYCLSSGVMASVVLPFFATPVRHTYSGFEPVGECGTWLDGGLRSAFPALRGLKMSRPGIAHEESGKTVPVLRVLAIETGRMDGLPKPEPKNVPGVAL